MGGTAVVLSGGAARGAYQVGMLRHLILEEGLDFTILRGVSIGSVNAAFLAQAPTGDAVPSGSTSHGELARQVRQLEELWTKRVTGNPSLYRTGFLRLLLLAVGGDSLFTLEPFRQLVREQLSYDALAGSGRDFAFGTVSLLSGGYEEFSPNEGCCRSSRVQPVRKREFVDRFIASSSIPGLFPFVRMISAQDVLVDGSLRNTTPLKSAFKSEPDKIYVLLASRVKPKQQNQIPDQAVPEHEYADWEDNLLGTRVGAKDALFRSAEILTDEVYLDDIRAAVRWNRVAEAIDSVADLAQEKKRELEAASATEPETASVKELGRASVEKLETEINRLKKEKDKLGGKRAIPIKVLAPRVWFDESQRSARDRNPAANYSPKLIKRAIAHGAEIAADRSLWLFDSER